MLWASACATVATLLLSFHAATTFAQGSMGGSIGKQDKSVSGDQDGGGARPSSRERSPSKRSGSGASGKGGNFDGKWNSAAFGKNCSGGGTDVVTISGGQISGTGLTGTVSGSGSMNATWSGKGLSASISGRLSGTRGSGTFQRSDGCVGTLTLSRQ
jgi:hypothetical protein